MIINTQCGTGKYRFKKVGYKDGGLLMEFILIHDSDFEDTEKIYQKTQEDAPGNPMESDNSNNTSDDSIEDADFEVVEDEVAK